MLKYSLPSKNRCDALLIARAFILVIGQLAGTAEEVGAVT